MRWVLCTICALFLDINLSYSQSETNFSTAFWASSGGLKALTYTDQPFPANPANDNTLGRQFFQASMRQDYLTDIRTVVMSWLSSKAPGRAVGLSFGSHGIDDFRINEASVRYTRQLSSSFHIGSRVTWRHFQVKGYENRSFPVVQLGLAGRNDPIFWGFSTAMTAENNAGFSGPLQYVAAAAGWQINPASALYSEFEHHAIHGQFLKVGIHHEPIPDLHFVLSLRSAPLVPAAGFGMNLNKNLRFFVAMEGHQMLGPSFLIDLVYIRQTH